MVREPAPEHHEDPAECVPREEPTHDEQGQAGYADRPARDPVPAHHLDEQDHDGQRHRHGDQVAHRGQRAAALQHHAEHDELQHRCPGPATRAQRTGERCDPARDTGQRRDDVHGGRGVLPGDLAQERGGGVGVDVRHEPEHPGQAEQRDGAARDGGADECGAGQAFHDGSFRSVVRYAFTLPSGRGALPPPTGGYRLVAGGYVGIRSRV
jgi:hypothetical protein